MNVILLTAPSVTKEPPDLSRMLALISGKLSESRSPHQSLLFEALTFEAYALVAKISIV